jgi:hypothetical protein
MALPVTDPFWVALLVIVPVAVVAGLIVYLRAEHMAAPAVLSARGADALRRTGGVGAAFSTALLGAILALLYGWLVDVVPQSASMIFSIGGVVAGVVLALAAVVVRRGRGLEGGWELVVLALLWGCGFGLLIPWVG